MGGLLHPGEEDFAVRGDEGARIVIEKIARGDAGETADSGAPLMVMSGVSLGVKFMSMLPIRARTSPVGIVVTVGYQRRLLIVGPELQVLEAGSKISVVARPVPLVGAG
jgi:hypothetical protein